MFQLTQWMGKQFTASGEAEKSIKMIGILKSPSFSQLYLRSSLAPHSSTLAWKIPWTEEPGRLQSMGLRRGGHDWATSLSLFTFMHWRRKWQPTPVFLPGEFQLNFFVKRLLWWSLNLKNHSHPISWELQFTPWEFSGLQAQETAP